MRNRYITYVWLVILASALALAVAAGGDMAMDFLNNLPISTIAPFVDAIFLSAIAGLICGLIVQWVFRSIFWSIILQGVLTAPLIIFGVVVAMAAGGRWIWEAVSR